MPPFWVFDEGVWIKFELLLPILDWFERRNRKLVGASFCFRWLRKKTTSKATAVRPRKIVTSLITTHNFSKYYIDMKFKRFDAGSKLITRPLFK